MMPWEPLDRDVLQALRDGQALCPECLGHKHRVVLISRDFLGDREKRIALFCNACGGTGLEGNVADEQRAKGSR